MSQAPRALSLFISYSHKDDATREKLDTHLALLKRQRVFDVWHDRRISGGREWANAIDEALERADVVLLLVSADFIASDYCYDRELDRAMQRHEGRAARVVPVILRACDWHTSVFGKLQALPRDGLPVERHPQGVDVALTEVAKSLRSIADELRGVPGSIVSGRVQGTGQAMPIAEPAAPVTPAGPVAPPARKLKIGAVKIWPFEVGPFEIDWPLRLGRQAVRLVLGGGVLALLVCSVSYLLVLRPALGEARDAMRLRDYARAEERLERVPKLVAWWPERRALHAQAQFGARLSRGEPISDRLLELETLVSRYPGAPDVLVFQGLRHFYVNHDFAKAIEAFTAAASADPRHAEAHFLAAGLHQELASQSLDRGDEASARDEYAKARALIDRAIERSPVAADVKRYANQRASLRDILGDVPGAYKAYARLAASDAMSAVQAAMISWRLPDSIGEVRDGKDAAQAQSAKLQVDPPDAVEGWMFGIPARGAVIVGALSDKRCLADWAVSISDSIIEAHASGQHAVASPEAKSPAAGAGGVVPLRSLSPPKSCSVAENPGAVRAVVCIKILAAQQALPSAHPRIRELEAWKRAAPACDPDLKPPAVLQPLEGQRVTWHGDWRGSGTWIGPMTLMSALSSHTVLASTHLEVEWGCPCAT